jgi:hypothetical protein
MSTAMVTGSGVQLSLVVPVHNEHDALPELPQRYPSRREGPR